MCLVLTALCSTSQHLQIVSGDTLVDQVPIRLLRNANVMLTSYSFQQEEISLLQNQISTKDSLTLELESKITILKQKDNANNMVIHNMESLSGVDARHIRRLEKKNKQLKVSTTFSAIVALVTYLSKKQ